MRRQRRGVGVALAALALALGACSQPPELARDEAPFETAAEELADCVGALAAHAAIAPRSGVGLVGNKEEQRYRALMERLEGEAGDAAPAHAESAQRRWLARTPAEREVRARLCAEKYLEEH